MEQPASYTTKLCPLVGAGTEEAATEKRRQVGEAPEVIVPNSKLKIVSIK
jgi:hypothetical protein